MSKPPRIISDSELESLLREHGIKSEIMRVGDEEFVLSTPTWMQSSFREFWHTFLVQSGFDYIREAQDCDDYARMAAAMSQMLHASNQGRPEGTALAVGEFWYSMGSHAIVCAVHQDGSYLTLEFYEPQPDKNGTTFTTVKLSEQQIRSCTHVRF